MTNRKIREDRPTTAAEDLLPGSAIIPAEIPAEGEEPFVPRSRRPTLEEDDDEPEDETEAAVTVEAWAEAGGVPLEGRDQERFGAPLAALGAFVTVMRSEGKGAARPSYYARHFRRFMREPR